MPTQSVLHDLEVGLCWGTVQQAGLVEMIEGAARHGFPTIQICPEMYFAYREAGGEDAALPRLLSDAGVRVRLIDGIASGLPGLPEGSMKFKDRILERHDVDVCGVLAELVGAPVINLTPYGGEQRPAEEMADALGKIARRASGYGASIVIEALPESAFGTLAETREVIDRCGEPNCFATFDVWHLTRSGGTVADLHALPAGSIGAIQISDRIEPEPGAPYVPMSGRKLPGEGELDLGEFLAGALDNSPGLTAEIEVFSDELASLPVEDVFARVRSAVDTWKAKEGAGAPN